MTYRYPRKSLLGDILLILALLVPSIGLAETLYVTDTLRLSLYQEPGGNAEVIKLMTSGDALEVLEKKGAYARVRTAQGEEGWAKLGFLVAEKPAVLIIEEAEAEKARLQSQIDTLRAANDGSLERRLGELEAEVSRLNDELEEATEARDEAQARVASLEELLNPSSESDRRLRRGLIAAGALAVMVLIGFVIGLKVMAGRVRRRFGGMKVW
jgi:SH3 domain protein